MELTIQNIEDKIYIIRDTKIMIDSDLAKLYQVETKVLNQAVKRNIDRFPSDFLFQLTKDELENLKSQIVTSSWGGTRKMPFAFSQDGIAMLSSILKSKKAIQVNIQIIRTFTKMREFTINYKDIVIELQNIKEELKITKENGEQNNQHIKTAFELLSQIVEDTAKTDKNLIGFRPDGK